MSDKVKFGFETTELIAMTNVNQEKEVIQSGEFLIICISYVKKQYKTRLKKLNK